MLKTPIDSSSEHGNPEKYMAFWEHLEELRWAIIKSLVVLAVGTCLGFAFTEFLYAFLLRPLTVIQQEVELIFAAPLDAFMIKMKLAFLAGAFMAVPFMLAFFWSFVAPGLSARERQAVWYGAGWGTFLFCVGVAFGFALLPYGLRFLVSFGPAGVRQLWSMQVYFDFCCRLLLGFGVVFQLPVVLVILVRLDIVQVETLARNRPYAIIVAFVVAALLTPPDVVSQFALGLPIMLLYEISILAARWQQRQRHKRNGSACDQV